MGLFNHPFVVRYNGLSLIAMPSLDVVVTFFQNCLDILVTYWIYFYDIVLLTSERINHLE